MTSTMSRKRVHVLVGSQNPVKIQATDEAFSTFFQSVTVLGLKVPSHVSDQPVNDDTFIGALNRANELKEINDTEKLNAHYFVGIEGGITHRYSRWFAFGGVCVMDTQLNVGFGASAHFELPETIVQKLLQGIELGIIMDEISGDSNTKQKGGAIGYLTQGTVSRKDIYVQGIYAALVPFLNKNLYFPNQKPEINNDFE